jgi:CRP/FNR family transcriptional regulator, anaerobic regulatory protein
MKELLSLLNNICLLSPALQQYLLDTINIKTYRKKSLLLAEGQVCRHIFFIRKGLVRSFYYEGAADISSKFMKEGEIIVAAGSFFKQTETDELLQAVEDTTVWSLSYDDFLICCKQFPEFNCIARVIATRAYMLCEQRLRFVRMKQASNRYNAMLQFFPELILRVPAKYIASYLGISVETLSRIRSGAY